MGGMIEETFPVGVTKVTLLEDEIRSLRAQLAEANAERGKLETLIFNAHGKAFGDRHYAYVDSQTTIDLLISDLKATQAERDAANAARERAEEKRAELVCQRILVVETLRKHNALPVLGELPSSAIERLVANLNNRIDALRARAEQAESMVQTWEAATRRTAEEDGVQYVGPNTASAISDALRARVEAAENSWKCYHCGKVFSDAVLAAEHFGDDRANPRPAACEGMLNAYAEAFERYGIHRPYHNAASVKQLAQKAAAAEDRAGAAALRREADDSDFRRAEAKCIASHIEDALSDSHFAEAGYMEPLAAYQHARTTALWVCEVHADGREGAPHGGQAAPAPWTPRERRLRAALETLNHAAKVAVSTEYGASFEEDTPLTIRLLDGTCAATDEALAEAPPPDPRDEALRVAEEALMAIGRQYHSGTVEICQEALAAIRAAREEK